MRLRAEPLHRHRLEDPWRATETIGPRHAIEQLRFALAREATDGAVGDTLAVLVELAWLEMLRDEGHDLPAHVVAEEAPDVPAVEERQGRRDARVLMPRRAKASVLVAPRRGRLAEVVAQRAEHDGEGPRTVETSDQADRLVHDLQRVHPAVTLGMPLGVLWCVGEWQKLGRDDLQHRPLAQQAQADRRLARLEQQLLELTEHALARELAQRHRGAQL